MQITRRSVIGVGGGSHGGGDRCRAGARAAEF